MRDRTRRRWLAMALMRSIVVAPVELRVGPRSFSGNDEYAQAVFLA